MNQSACCHNPHLRREARQRSEMGNEGTRTRLIVKTNMILLMVVIMIVLDGDHCDDVLV